MSRKKKARPNAALQVSAGDVPALRTVLIIAAGIVVVAAGFAVYFNSLSAAFVLDDVKRIVHEERIRSLTPVWQHLTHRRPVVSFSLAVNYAWGGLEVAGYHAFNLGAHLLAALFLMGVVRRTLLRGGHQASRALAAAFAVALLWVVHPLTTQSVTYVIQRGEALMALFLLITLYCVIRGADSPHARRWYVAAVLACALGMGSKAVMVVAPVVVLLYDRTFLTSTFSHALRRRWGLYAGLAATWLILAACGVVRGVFFPPEDAHASVGFGYEGVSPLDYALSQPDVILYYLRLVVWPVGLCLDYGWPVADSFGRIVPPLAAVAVLLALTIWGLWRRHGLGFAGAAFFLILAPTSSFIPIKDLAFEHRMYLPLAAVIVVVVFGVRWLLAALIKSATGSRRAVSVGALLAAVCLLGYRTVDRNKAYASEVTMWQDVAARRPSSPRAHVGLGTALASEGRHQEAVDCYRRALALDEKNHQAQANLGTALAKLEQYDEAIAVYRRLLEIEPTSHAAQSNLARTLARLERYDEALIEYRKALDLEPTAVLHHSLGLTLEQMGRRDDAIAQFREALKLDPGMKAANRNLAIALAAAGNVGEALAGLRQAVTRDPQDGHARAQLGAMLLDQGRHDEAISELRQATRLLPDLADAHYNLGRALSMAGQSVAAADAYRAALKILPIHALARTNLAVELSKLGEHEEAVKQFESVVQFDRANTNAYYNMANTLVVMGRTDQAVVAFRKTLEIDPKFIEANVNLGKLLQSSGKVDEAIEQYRQALKVDPDKFEAHYNLGTALAGQGKEDEAIEAFRQAVASRPNNPAARSALKQMLDRQASRRGQ